MTKENKKLKKPLHFTSSGYPNNHNLPIKYFTRYLNDENKPFYILERLREEQLNIPPSDNTSYIGVVVCRDLRVANNPALCSAIKRSKKTTKPVVAIVPISEKVLKAHMMSPFQWAYYYNALNLLQDHLSGYHIPVIYLPCENIASSVASFCRENGILDLYGNIEYEVDELRVAISLMRETGLKFTPLHHTCAVKPGDLATQKGTQYAVFTPWYRSWLSHLESHPEVLHEVSVPEISKQDKAVMDTFAEWSKQPSPAKKLLADQQAIFDKHYKIVSLDDPIKHFASSFQDDVLHYTEVRDTLSKYPRMSPHLAMGTVTTVQLINYTLNELGSKSIRISDPHCIEYIRQLAWRDFYRHVVANWPHVCMYRPFQLDYIDVQWTHDEELFDKWCQGKTGYPIIDALMRQLQATGSMPNRCRMMVACFLLKNLLIDWRYGERWFALHLVDFDFALNNGGWGFASSVGVDPQPYFRIFNPLLQSKKFDPDGTFIRYWVPELKDAPMVHDPYADEELAKIAESNGYPKMVVDYKATKERALEAYKNAR